MIKGRMEGVGVRVEITTLSPTVSLSDALDSAAQRGLLYCVIITSQHELHRSLTLTILHGRNPQGKLPWRLRTIFFTMGKYRTVCNVFLRTNTFLKWQLFTVYIAVALSTKEFFRFTQYEDTVFYW